MPVDNPTSLFDAASIKKITKYLAIVFTIIYIASFHSCFYLGMASFMIFGSPHSIFPVDLLIVFLMLSISLSMPFSIYLIWSSYRQGLYKKTLFFCVLPSTIYVAVYLIIPALEFLVRYFAPALI